MLSLLFGQMGKDGTCVCTRQHFLAYNQLLPEQVVHVPCAQKDVNHLCHSPMCVEFEHLNLEDHAVNNGRKVCHTQGFCSGHHHHPNCIF